MSGNGGFESGFSSDIGGSGFNQGFAKRRAVVSAGGGLGDGRSTLHQH